MFSDFCDILFRCNFISLFFAAFNILRYPVALSEHGARISHEWP